VLRNGSSSLAASVGRVGVDGKVGKKRKLKTDLMKRISDSGDGNKTSEILSLINLPETSATTHELCESHKLNTSFP
jgi:hypothetical protein